MEGVGADEAVGDVRPASRRNDLTGVGVLPLTPLTGVPASSLSVSVSPKGV